MPSLSPFQRLPLFVAETIFCYCHTPGFTHEQTEHDNLNEEQQAWAKLYNVSYCWRVLALKYFLKEITLIISTKNGTARLEFVHLPQDLDLHTTRCSYDHVKRVNIKYSGIGQQASKGSLKDASETWPDALVFPLATSLNIELDRLRCQKVEKYATWTNDCFSWISQRIRTSMPKLQEVIIDEKAPLGGSHIDEEQALYSFLSTVFDKATRLCARINHSHLVSDYSFIQSGPGLCSLKYYCSAKDSLFHYIVRMSSLTLESLTLEDLNLQNVRPLVLCDNGRPIVYPRLKRLDFRSRLDSKDHETLHVGKSSAPFPMLRYLRWSARYIFGDDMLFRGNSSTLEHLHLELDPNMIGILNEHKVFANGKYPQLRCITLSDTDYYSVGSMLSPDLFSGFATTTLSPATRSISLKCESPYRNVIGIFGSNSYSGNIQIISLVGTTMALPELLGLVKMLPSARKLCCGSGMSNFEHHKRGDRLLVRELYATYYPLTNCLKYWEIHDESLGDIHLVAEAALVLAILCPNFVSALVSQDSMDDYTGNVERYMVEGLYDDYRDTLQRFLRNLF